MRARVYDLSGCTTKSLNGFSQSSIADAAAFPEVYDVKHQRKGNNDHIHEMSFSPTLSEEFVEFLPPPSHNLSTVAREGLCSRTLFEKGRPHFPVIRGRSGTSTVASSFSKCADWS